MNKNLYLCVWRYPGMADNIECGFNQATTPEEARAMVGSNWEHIGKIEDIRIWLVNQETLELTEQKP